MGDVGHAGKGQAHRPQAVLEALEARGAQPEVDGGRDGGTRLQSNHPALQVEALALGAQGLLEAAQLPSPGAQAVAVKKVDAVKQKPTALLDGKLSELGPASGSRHASPSAMGSPSAASDTPAHAGPSTAA